MIPGAAKEGARIAKAAKAKAAKAKRPKEDPGLTAARNVVRARSHGLCEFQIPLVCTYQGVLAHHRLRRSHTTGHDPQTMVWICSKCHEYTHANPQLAYEKGWMIRS